MSYISFFITSVAENRIDDYKKLANAMADLWMKHGALEVQEFIGVDTPTGKSTSYPQAVFAEDGEIIITGYVKYNSKEDKEKIMGIIMSDPEMQTLFKDASMNGQNMIFGDFAQLINKS